MEYILKMPGGRPKGLTDYKLDSMRRLIMEKVDPLKNIMEIAKGNPIPGVPAPTPDDVLGANYQLLKRVVPELKSVEITGANGEPLQVETTVNAANAIIDRLNKLAASKAQGD